MNVLVLAGGASNERDVSLRSGQAVRTALLQNKHKVIECDPGLGLEQLEQFAGKVDVVFPALHGSQGEDGKVQ